MLCQSARSARGEMNQEPYLATGRGAVAWLADAARDCGRRERRVTGFQQGWQKVDSARFIVQIDSGV